MGALRNLTRRIFGDGGNIPQAGGMFSPLAYGAMKPIVQEAYNVKDYVKEAKDSEENQLKAFNEMKVAQALSIDQENSKKLHDSYSGAFDQASKELSNPFTLSRFAQKQAIDYVNNPLRKNIEDSSKNLEMSKEVAAKTPDVDPNATNGAINKALWMHEKNGGTNIDKNSVLGIVPPIRNQDLKESIQSAETLAHNLLKTSYSGLGKPTQDYLAGMGITQDTWNASNFDKTQAIADLVLKNNTGFKNSIFSREFQNEFEKYKIKFPQATDKEAREQAGKTYEQIGKEKIAETTRNLEKTLRIKDSGSKMDHFALPQGSGSSQNPNYGQEMGSIDAEVTPEEEFDAQKEGLQNIRQNILGQNKNHDEKVDDLSIRKGLLEKINSKEGLTAKSLKDAINSAGLIKWEGGTNKSIPWEGKPNETVKDQKDVNQLNKIRVEFHTLNHFLDKNNQIDTKNLASEKNIDKIKTAYMNSKAISGISKNFTATNFSKDVFEKMNMIIGGGDLKNIDDKLIERKGPAEWNSKTKIKNNVVYGQVNYTDTNDIVKTSWVKLPDSFQISNNQHLKNVLRLKEDVKHNGVTKENSENVGFDENGLIGAKTGRKFRRPDGKIIEEVIPFEDVIRRSMSVDYNSNINFNSNHSQWQGEKMRDIYLGEPDIQ